MRPAREQRQGLELVLPEDREGAEPGVTLDKARHIHRQRKRAWNRYPKGQRPACPGECNGKLLPVPLEKLNTKAEDPVFIGAPIWNASWCCPDCHLIADHRGRDLRGEP